MTPVNLLPFIHLIRLAGKSVKLPKMGATFSIFACISLIDPAGRNASGSADVASFVGPT